MALNPFHHHSKSASGPAFGSLAITPNNSADLATDIRAITIGGAGTLSWVGVDGVTHDTASLPAGTMATQLTGWI